MSLAPSRIGASAPGKLLIAGEYVVLTGSPAIVSAVPYRAFARWTDDPQHPHAARPLGDEPRYPEAAAARRAAEARVGEVEGELIIDVSALRHEDQKLGLGSSAASAAAAAAAVFASRGHDLRDEAVRREVLDAALEGHSAVAPRGSGVDVAASVMGGTVRYVREPRSVQVVRWPEALAPRVIWTGRPAKTRDFLDKLEALREDDPSAYSAAMAALEDATDVFVAAFRRGAVEPALTAAAFLCGRLAALGDACGAPVVDARIRRIVGLAETYGGAAKPSGAGGGDVAIAFFEGEPSAERFCAECERVGFKVLRVRLLTPEEGVRAEVG